MGWFWVGTFGLGVYKLRFGVLVETVPVFICCYYMDSPCGVTGLKENAMVYYVEGLNHNLVSVGQFCDANLEVAFPKSMCFVRDLQGNDLLTGNRGSDLYTISLQETTLTTLICLMVKASPTQAWLWHRRLSHLNFDCINMLSKKDAVIGLPMLKYVKDQLCSSSEVSKAKRGLFKTKIVLNSKGRLNLLHMDLCGPMRVACINGKKYILASDYDNSNPVPQIQNALSSAYTIVPSQQELDLILGPLYAEFFTAEPSTATNVHAEENNANQVKDEFTNPFCTLVREVAESSSHNIGNSNFHTFNQPQDSEYQWTKDHPLEQVHGNPSKPVQTRQLVTDPEMCMFALTSAIAISCNPVQHSRAKQIHTQYHFIKEHVENGERKPKKGQNRIKTGQKQETWRNREKSKAVTVDRG
nr:retrovirus-related Pol polyprotein from transposon TNT 1-94 [Tanacetum cinerariifolium]